MMQNLTPFGALRNAARYVRCFRDRIFVIKLGGELLVEPSVRKILVEQVAVLVSFGIKVVLVHGGGNQLDDYCKALTIETEKIAGRRITSPEALEAAKAVFCGTQVGLLADLQAAGISCAGLSGVDGGLFMAHRRPPVDVVPDGQTEAIKVDFGLVGDLDSVNTELVTHLLDGGYVPVVAPLTMDVSGQVLNTNADTLASALATALKAEKLFFLLTVPGLLEDASNPSSLVTSATPAELKVLEDKGSIKSGMRPKLKAALEALNQGVHSCHLVSGTTQDALLAEVFTNEGSGTLLVLKHEGA